ncbi:MAG TPA: TlyA family RNA methyltransferase [Syntrophorhabdales bacterium]|nr:TlyA family RNA methyltransferase [Syntrophorhabdales bacterium]
MAKQRIDTLLAQKAFVDSREKAKILVMAGAVYVEGQRVVKPDQHVDVNAHIEVRSGGLPYVSFGGTKLKHALEAFGLSVKGKRALDVGSSTGGFVDCMLQEGAVGVYAVDVGAHQLHEKVRRDPRVVPLEGVNARYLTLGQIGGDVDIATVDVSFISLKKILPALVSLLHRGAVLVTLVKPQFEVGRYQVGKGGIVKDQERVRAVIEDIRKFGEGLGLRPKSVTEAPREKERKNREYFILWEL